MAIFDCDTPWRSLHCFPSIDRENYDFRGQKIEQNQSVSIGEYNLVIFSEARTPPTYCHVYSGLIKQRPFCKGT